MTYQTTGLTLAYQTYQKQFNKDYKMKIKTNVPTIIKIDGLTIKSNIPYEMRVK